MPVGSLQGHGSGQRRGQATDPLDDPRLSEALGSPARSPYDGRTMELNTILLWLACVSCGVTLLRLLGGLRRGARPERVAARLGQSSSARLGCAGGSGPTRPGTSAGGLWAALVVVPLARSGGCGGWPPASNSPGPALRPVAPLAAPVGRLVRAAANAPGAGPGRPGRGRRGGRGLPTAAKLPLAGAGRHRSPVSPPPAVGGIAGVGRPLSGPGVGGSGPGRAADVPARLGGGGRRGRPGRRLRPGPYGAAGFGGRAAALPALPLRVLRPAAAGRAPVRRAAVGPARRRPAVLARHRRDGGRPARRRRGAPA